MTNKEKAKEIYKDNLYDCEVRGIVQDEQEILFMLEKMAKWKEEQIIEKAVKWLEENAQDYTYDDYGIMAFIRNKQLKEDFKKAMEE